MARRKRPTPEQQRVIDMYDGEPLDILLPRLVNEYGSQSAVSDVIKVSKATLSYWLVKSDVEIHSIAVPKGYSLLLMNNETRATQTLVAN